MKNKILLMTTAIVALSWNTAQADVEKGQTFFKKMCSMP